MRPESSSVADMQRFFHGSAVSLLFLLTSLSGCASCTAEEDAIRAAAIRHFLSEYDLASDTLLLSVDGGDPSGELIERLDDLGIRAMGKQPSAPTLDGDESLPDVSVRRLRWRWFNRAIVEISIFVPPHAAHGAVYRLRRNGGGWHVVRIEKEWMT